jgi:hypothetical protein
MPTSGWRNLRTSLSAARTRHTTRSELALTSVFLTTLSRLGLHPPAMQAFFRLVLATPSLDLGRG